MQRDSSHVGLFYGTGAYFVWGLFPAFFGLLAFAGPAEIVAHRIVWTLVVMLAVLAVMGRLRGLREIPLKTWLFVAAGAAALSTNWGVYVYAVTSGQVVECALGYFVNPLVSVLFGVVLFRERLSRAQIVAVGLAFVAVVVLTVDYGRPPLIALTLALSFAVYGLVKKLVPLDPIRSVAAESLTALPFAVAYLVVLTVTGTGVLVAGDTGHLLLVLLSGPITTVPLVLFGAAAQRIPLSTIGILQYLTPALQMIWGVVVLHEAMPGSRWVGFALIWVALVVFTVDALTRSRIRSRAAAVAVVDEPSGEPQLSQPSRPCAPSET